MIRYALACDKAHEFESWFPSSQAYDAQLARGLVTCPVCGSAEVAKQIMAPSVARTDRLPAAPVEAPPVQPPEASQPVAILSEREQELRAMVKAFREHVTQNADDVGTAFAKEARKMHYGETERRSIYGKADLLEAKALIDEGIEFHPLPMVPDEHH